MVVVATKESAIKNISKKLFFFSSNIVTLDEGNRVRRMVIVSILSVSSYISLTKSHFLRVSFPHLKIRRLNWLSSRFSFSSKTSSSKVTVV